MKKLSVTFTIIVVLALALSSVFAQDKREIRDGVREYHQNNQHKIIKEYVDFLSVPNVAADKEGIRKNAKLIKAMMEARGIETHIMETNGNPIVYGELKVPGAKRTLMFYEHYDGQPADESKWIDSKPWVPVLREGKLDPATGQPQPVPFPGKEVKLQNDWRIYARSTGDDKAPVVGLLTAIDALRANGWEPKNNLKFIFEGEEEASSPSLFPYLKEHKDLLKCDLLFICDGPTYYNGEPTLFFGVRGIVSVNITVYGPNTALHSGHYGNWAPNPGMRLSHLLGSMKDADGKVLIDNFYDTVEPYSPLEMDALNKIPPYDEYLKKQLGIKRPEGGGKTLMETITLPSLNIRGMSSGWVGAQARTIVPESATAAIDIRLVKGTQPDYMVNSVIDHVKKMGYHVVDEVPDNETRMKHDYIAFITRSKGYPASRTSMDLPVSKAVLNMLDGYHEENVAVMPTLGGSVPIYFFTEALNVPVIGLPIANYDNNQHQSNENMRLGNFWKGIETYAAILMMK